MINIMKLLHLPPLKMCQRVHFHFLEIAINNHYLIQLQEKRICIVCNEKKYNKEQKAELKTMPIKELKETVHKAGKSYWVSKLDFLGI